jgi:hypothetical protein
MQYIVTAAPSLVLIHEMFEELVVDLYETANSLAAR